jgi:hypothetical protein
MSEPLTRADVIAKVRDHFTRPGAVLAWNEDEEESTCVYRMDEDASSSVRCAMGVLIPDEAYSPKMEGHNADGVAEAYGLSGLFAPGVVVDGDGSSWINALQRVHDAHAKVGATMEDFLAALDSFERETT